MKRRMDLKELLVRVAELYYMEGLTQEAIAQMLDLSRPEVSRYLKRARELGIVESLGRERSAGSLDPHVFPTVCDRSEYRG